MSKPDYIDRYDYGREGVVYMEPPAFITGADRYVPTAQIEAALAETNRVRAGIERLRSKSERDEERRVYVRRACDLVDEALHILRDVRWLDQADELDRVI